MCINPNLLSTLFTTTAEKMRELKYAWDDNSGWFGQVMTTSKKEGVRR